MLQLQKLIRGFGYDLAIFNTGKYDLYFDDILP